MQTASLIDRARVALGAVGRGALLGTGWQLARAAAHLLWVIAVARLLGPENYGTLAGVMGLAATVGTITGLGFGVVLLLDVSRDRNCFGIAWKRALWTCIGSGTCLVVIFILVAPTIIGFSTPVVVLLALAIAEIICFPLTVLSSYAFQAHDRMGWAYALYAVVQTASVIAVALYAGLSSQPTLEAYVVFHAIGAVAVTLMLLGFTQTRLQPLAAGFDCSPVQLRRGVDLSFMRTADMALNTLDKTLVLRIGGDEMAGIYAVAARLATALALPVVTLSSAALPKLSRAGSDASTERGLVSKLLAAALAWGAVAAIGMVVLGGLLPALLGEGFKASANLAQKLALLPVMLGLCAIGCAVLLARNRHRVRVFVQLSGIAVLFIASSQLIPAFGLDGAALATFAAQAFTAAGLWLAIRRCGRPANPSVRGEARGH